MIAITECLPPAVLRDCSGFVTQDAHGEPPELGGSDPRVSRWTSKGKTIQNIRDLPNFIWNIYIYISIYIYIVSVK